MNSKAEVAEVAERLRKSTKQLCRNLKDNPNVTENMAKVAAERAQLQVLLNKCLNELEAIREVPCLVSMVTAEEQKEIMTKETIQREKVDDITTLLHVRLESGAQSFETGNFPCAGNYCCCAKPSGHAPAGEGGA